MSDDLLSRVDQIPGPDGWWHAGNGDEYRLLARHLRDWGLMDDDIVNVLGSAYAAAADEFGS